jgi:hypothetical protein
MNLIIFSKDKILNLGIFSNQEFKGKIIAPLFNEFEFSIQGMKYILRFELNNDFSECMKWYFCSFTVRIMLEFSRFNDIFFVENASFNSLFLKE